MLEMEFRREIFKRSLCEVKAQTNNYCTFYDEVSNERKLAKI